MSSTVWNGRDDDHHECEPAADRHVRGNAFSSDVSAAVSINTSNPVNIIAQLGNPWHKGLEMVLNDSLIAPLMR